MKKSIVLFFLLCTLLSFAQPSEIVVADSVFNRYKKLNDADTVLKAFKDDDATLLLKLQQVAFINQNRKKFNVQAVQLDILASRVANKMCREAGENDFAGHWNLAGEKPYHRYAFAGGKDHVFENGYARYAGSSFEISNEKKAEFMQKGHSSFMEEKAPEDAHKQNCISKDHNFVGIGLFLNEKQFRYYEEFIDRYLEFGSFATVVKAGKKITIDVKADKDEVLKSACAYYEKPLQAMSAAKINSMGGYGDYSETKETEYYEQQLSALKKEQTYSIPFEFKKKGLYYIYIWIQKGEPKKKNAFNPEEWIGASGIVIRVE